MRSSKKWRARLFELVSLKSKYLGGKEDNTKKKKRKTIGGVVPSFPAQIIMRLDWGTRAHFVE